MAKSVNAGDLKSPGSNPLRVQIPPSALGGKWGMAVPCREVPIPFVGLEALVLNKRAAGRAKDLDDLSYLIKKF